MRRRTLVHTLAGGLSVAIAGCTGDGDDDADNGGSNGESDADGSTGEPDTSGDDSTDGSEAELTTIESITAVENRYDDESRTFSGSGSELTDEFDLEDSLTVFTAEYDGEGQFTPELVDEPRLRRILPIAVHEPYTGTGGAGVPADTYRLDVIASGDWSVEIAQPTAPDEAIHQLPVEASGDGQDVVGPVELTGQATVTFTHDDETGFLVEALDEAGRGEFGQTVQVFDDLGEFSEQERIEMNAVCWIHVNAEAPWTIEIE